MTNLRKSIIFLALHLIVVFNLERVTLAGQKIAIHPFFYVLIVAAIVANISLPFLRRLSIYSLQAFWILVFSAYRLIALRQIPLFEDNGLYLAITELALLSISVFLSNELSHHIHDIEDIIDKVTFSGIGQKIVKADEAAQDIQVEINRSRRYDRPLSVLVIKPVSGSMSEEVKKKLNDLQQQMVDRYLIASFAQSIGKVARRSDLIIEEGQEDRFVILCPETSTEGLSVLAERIQNAVNEQLGVTTVWGSASFPEEGLTFESLVEKAETNLVQQFGTQVSAQTVQEPAENPQKNR